MAAILISTDRKGTRGSIVLTAEKLTAVRSHLEVIVEPLARSRSQMATAESNLRSEAHREDDNIRSATAGVVFFC